MSEGRTVDAIGGAALPAPAPDHSLRDRLVAIAVIGGGALVTFFWIVALVYALIIALF